MASINWLLFVYWFRRRHIERARIGSIMTRESWVRSDEPQKKTLESFIFNRGWAAESSIEDSAAHRELKIKLCKPWWKFENLDCFWKLDLQLSTFNFSLSTFKNTWTRPLTHISGTRTCLPYVCNALTLAELGELISPKLRGVFTSFLQRWLDQFLN